MLTRTCIIFLLFFSTVQSASLLERSYEYVLNLGKNIGPSVMSIVDCFGEDDAWNCAKEKAGRILDNWDEQVDKQRRKWQEDADAEVRSSGRAINEMPSQLGKEVEQSLESLANVIQYVVSRHNTDTMSSNNNPNMMKKQQEESRGFSSGKVQSWIIGPRDLVTDDVESIQTASRKNDDARSVVNNPLSEEADSEDSQTDLESKIEWNDSKDGEVNFRKGRDLVSDIWGIGEKALDALADHVIENENAENGIQDKSSFEEQRGKKKKKKKAILKLLILGAVLKAKIGTLLQILSFKLQVKFFIIALIGLAINLARFWVELKNKHQQPQKVIYYEHAQHQHHYEHEEEPGWGPWSRSIDPEEAEVELDAEGGGPYSAQERIARSTRRPLLTLA